MAMSKITGKTVTIEDHYIAVNDYRGSSSDGFANTWSYYVCSGRRQRELLTTGLPVSDECWEDASGIRHASYSTMGIRLLTSAERRRAARDHYIESIDD